MTVGPAAEDEETPGLASERTDMAWSRSGLAVLACLAALAKKLLPELSTVSGPTILWAALGVAATAWALSMVWARAVAQRTLAGLKVERHATLRLVSYGTATLGIAAACVALLPG